MSRRLSPELAARHDAGADALPAAALAPGWPMALALLGAGVLALGLLFLEEGAAAVQVWEISETYNHCWLVLPLALWLAWARRHRLRGLAPRPSPAFALLAVPVGLAWLAAERLGIMEGRQLTALTLLPVLVLSVLGWRITRAMAAPLLYLYFMVPFGAFITPTLQHITARMVDLGLDLTGIAHYVDDLVIETPAGVFLVAEACAGLRFLIAAIAFGALYAFVMFRSPGRRIAVMALAVVVPIFANGLRALGIVVLGSILGSAEAAAADHILYGWIFFSIVMLLLILAGLPFREDTTPEPYATPAVPQAGPRPVALATAALLAAGLAAVAPVAAMSLGQAGARAPMRHPVALATLDECTPLPGGTALGCGDYRMSAEIIVFPAQATWRLVSAELGRVAGRGDQDIGFDVRTPAAAWRARQQRDEGGTVAVASFLNGGPSGGGLRARAEQAWNSLGGGDGRPVLAVVSLLPPEPGRLANVPRQRALVEELLRTQGAALAARAAALSGPAAR